MQLDQEIKYSSHRPRHLLIAIFIVWLSFFLLRLGGPPDLRAFDQERPASYIMDVVQNGNWICQRDSLNAIASKPPLYTWLAALTTIPFGKISRFTIYFPNALAVLITACIIFTAGRRLFGGNDGFIAALFYIISVPGLKQVCLSRTDPLFTLFVALAAVLAYRAWVFKRGWTWFWLAAAAVTLTKGPLGIILASGGLLAYFWERKEGKRLPFRGTHVPGLFMFLTISLGWFFLAYAHCGREFMATLVSRELVGHAVGGYNGKIPFIGFYKPSFYFLTRFFPWSILSIFGFWRIWRRPSQDLMCRRAERFIFCYFFLGLALFSLASHHRGDLIFPLLPAAAVVAGNIAAKRFHFPTARSLFVPAGAIVVTALIAAGAYYYLFRSHDPHVLSTCRLKEAAGQIAPMLTHNVRVEYVGTDYTLQFYLNTLQPLITPEEAVRLMSAPEPICIVMHSTYKDRITVYLADIPFYILFQSEDILVVSNHPPSRS